VKNALRDVGQHGAGSYRIEPSAWRALYRKAMPGIWEEHETGKTKPQADPV